MPSFTEFYRETLHLFFDPVQDPTIRRLLLLSSLGESGPQAPRLSLEFKELGIIHLLVLSGSQVQFFAGSLRFLILKIVPVAWSALWKTWILRVILGSGLWVFGATTLWQAPLTRALLTESFRLFIPGLRWVWVWMLGFLSQACLFPHHLREPGFYLSWAASLGLKWAQEFTWNPWLGLVGVSVLSQALLGIIKGVPDLSLEQWLLILLANLCVGSLFERTLMRGIGWVLALGYLVSLFLPMAGWGAELWNGIGFFLRPALEGSSTLVLVALRAFRYIQWL